MNEVRVTAQPDVRIINDRSSAIRVTLGQQGPRGAPGEASDSLALEGYVHTQALASDVWTVNHNLGRKPAVTLLSTGGVEFDGQITHVSVNQLVVSLSSAVAGTARCL
jgi:hypothetical protein